MLTLNSKIGEITFSQKVKKRNSTFGTEMFWPHSLTIISTKMVLIQEVFTHSLLIPNK